MKPDSVREICRLLGASETQAYAMLGRLEAVLLTLKLPPGRPRALAASPADAAYAVSTATSDFLMETPGAVEGRGARRRYHAAFRLFALSLLEEGRPGARMKLEEFADALRVPLGTLKDWLADPGESGARSDAAPGDFSEKELPSLDIQVPGIAVILREYPRWKGSFTAFCDHLRAHHRLPYGTSYIGTVLAMAGLRRRKPRKKATSPWDRGTFRKMFPGAQWVGDGMQLVFWFANETFLFNLEALVDPATSALVGFKVTDVEDEAAVLAAYQEGKETTGAPPLGMTLDNRPSNHTPGVKALTQSEDVHLLRSTPGRGQSKAPMEGAFGLFSQQMPELVVEGGSRRDQAREMLQKMVTAYARGRNGRPRKSLNGRTPADAYVTTQATPEEVAAAKQYLAQLDRIQEAQRRTKEAKSDPIRRQLLCEKLAEYEIPDPEGTLATELARYSLEAIQQGLATFRSKQRLNTIPAGADPGRYLGGIIRNIHAQKEDELFAEELLELRLRSRELTLRHLEEEADKLGAGKNPVELPSLILTRALKAEPLLDFRFWTRELREAVGQLGSPRIQRASYNWLVGEVGRSYQTRRYRRRAILATLTEVLAATDAA